MTASYCLSPRHTLPPPLSLRPPPASTDTVEATDRYGSVLTLRLVRQEPFSPAHLSSSVGLQRSMNTLHSDACQYLNGTQRPGE